MSYFKESYYLAQYADVRAAVSAGVFTSGLQHYQLYGGRELRNPSEDLDATFYVNTHADIRAWIAGSTTNTALGHFELAGVGENRTPSSDLIGFQPARYLSNNPDVQAAVTAGVFKSALDHYLQYGETENRSIHTSVTPYFDETYYLVHNLDVLLAVRQGVFTSGLQHFQQYGGREGRNPSANFNTEYYLSQNPEVQSAVTARVFNTALDHYALYGVAENRPATVSTAGFDATRYLAENPDVQAAVTAGNFRSALDHYVQYGSAELRAAYTTAGTTIVSASDTFVLTAQAVSVNEGGAIVFILQTVGAATGTPYDYTISGVSATDVQGGVLTGTVAIDAFGRASIPVILARDATTEGLETMTVTVAGTSAHVLVNDTSTSNQTFGLSAGAVSVNEGNQIVFTLQTVGVSAGTTYAYTIGGVQAVDVQGHVLTGTATIGEDGKALIPVILVNDGVTEGAEGLTLTVAGETASVIVNDTSTAGPQPTPTFTLTAGAASVNEGAIANFTLRTTNVAVGTQYTYTLTGVSAADVSGGLLTGTATIGADGTALIAVPLVSDIVTEGAETLTVTVAGRNASTTVNDTSVTPAQSFGLTLAVDSFTGGAGIDTFTGTYSNGGGETFNTDTLVGGGGTDTVSLTVGAEAVVFADSTWDNVTGMEKFKLDTTGGAGAQTITTGTNFSDAFTTGVDLTSQTLLGAITIDMTTYTQTAAITTNTIGAGATTVTGGSGATTVAARAFAAGDMIINGTGLSTVTATTDGAGSQTIGSVGLTNSLTSVTATILGAGNQTITSTSASAVTVTATAASGAQTITTGAGNDVITSSAVAGQTTTISTGAGNDTIVAGASVDLITAGTGADTITGGGAVDTFAMSTNGSVIGTSMDIITDFNTGGADRLTFGAGTNVLGADATALVAGSNVQQSAGGLITFHASDNTLALKTAAVQADVELDAVGAVAMFVNGGNTYVYYAGGAAGNADDQLIQLTGLTTLATITGGAQTTFA